MSISTTGALLPKTMKAEIIDRFGSPDEVMHTATIPVPELGEHDILIDVRTAGVGAWDPELCRGEFLAEAGLPRVLGSDGAGTVIATGAKARRFHVGDSVYAYGFGNPKGGFYAEYAVVSEDEAAKVPPSLSLEQAGVLAADGLTALAGLDTLELSGGETLAILGASGGVGHIALELAKRIGARVFAVASGSDGVDLARRLGADETIDGREGDVVTKARAFAPAGFDAALLLAGSGADELVALVKRGGSVAYPNGVEPVPARRRGIAVSGYDGYHGRDALERLNRLIEGGPFHVEVSAVYQLGSTPQALDDVTRHHLGKLAVKVHTA